MNKSEFLVKLGNGLSGLPKKDIEERLNFYNEMIEDRIEEGISEEEAVAAIGSADEIASQIIADTPFVKIAKERIKPKRRLTVLEIIFLVLGSPIWLSLLIALFAVVFSLYVSLWAVIISLWAVFGSLIASAVGVVLAGIILAINGKAFSGVALISAGLVIGGLSIFAFYGCEFATKGIVIFTKKTAVLIKNRFVKKEEAQ